MDNIPDIPFSLTEHEGNAHLAELAREHDTDSLDCWCQPTFYRVCMECDDGCWRCADGKNECTRVEAEWCSDPLLVVHRV